MNTGAQLSPRSAQNCNLQWMPLVLILKAFVELIILLDGRPPKLPALRPATLISAVVIFL